MHWPFDITKIMAFYCKNKNDHNRTRICVSSQKHLVFFTEKYDIMLLKENIFCL